MWITFIIFVFGISIGSFLNVCLFRVHEGRSVSRGRSKCLTCEHPIRFFDLVPVVSFFLLKGRCRHCQQALSWQYPLIEFMTGLLFVLFYLKYQYGWFGASFVSSLDGFYSLIREWILICFLIIIFVYDLRHMLILDRFTFPAMILAIILNLLVGSVTTTSMLMGALAFGGFFYGQFVFSKGTWVGGGDIRMGALIGLILGFSQGLVALFLAYVFGAIVGLILLLMKKVDRKTPIPFGTFLAFSTVLLLFFQETPLNWYLSFFV